MRPSIIERLAALALLALVLWFGYWISLGQVFTRTAALKTEIASIDDERNLLANRRYAPEDYDRIAEATARFADQADRIPRIENERLALAAAQDQVREKVEGAGAELVRMDARSTRPFEGSDLLEIVIDAQFESLQPTMPSLLSALEGSGPNRDLALETVLFRIDDPYRALREEGGQMLRGRFKGIMFFRTSLSPDAAKQGVTGG